MTIATYDEGSDGSDGGDALARAVVELNLDGVLLGLHRSLAFGQENSVRGDLDIREKS